jgi:hypothetical protein
MSADTSPYTVAQFLNAADQHVRRGDIILSRSPTLISWLIRKATGSAFSHAALVFLVSEPAEGYGNTFILESTGTGVGLANLRRAIGGKNPKLEIAVLRFKDPDLSPAFFKHARGLMLDYVQTEYDYGVIARLTLSLVFGARLSYAKMRKGSDAAMQMAVERTRKRILKWVPPQFICSGFIQFGLVKAAAFEGIDPSRVVLKNGLDIHDGDALLSVTPEDVSHSDKLQWLYVARRGWVYAVDNRERALKVISGGR